MKKLPKKLELLGVPDVPVSWEYLTTREDKFSDEAILLLPVPNIRGIINGRELRSHIYAKASTGDYISVGKDELAALKITDSLVEERLQFYYLKNALAEKGLEVDDDQVEKQAKEIAFKPNLIKGALEKLSQEARQIEQEETREVDDFADLDEDLPVTKKDLAEVMKQQAVSEDRPWLYLKPKEMNNKQFEMWVQELRRRSSAGESTACRPNKQGGLEFFERQKLKPSEPTEEPEEEAETEEPDTGLFGVKGAPKAVKDMDDKGFTDWVDKMKKEASQK